MRMAFFTPFTWTGGGQLPPALAGVLGVRLSKQKCRVDHLAPLLRRGLMVSFQQVEQHSNSLILSRVLLFPSSLSPIGYVSVEAADHDFVAVAILLFLQEYFEKVCEF